MKNILVIGSINMDMVIHTPRIPVLGETISGSNFATIPGGKGENQAVACSRLGCNVKMIGGVGNDIYGNALLKNLSENNVGTDGIKVFDTTSGIAIITVCGGDNHIILDSGANGMVDKATIDENMALIRWADIVVFQFEIPEDSIYYAMKIAKENHKTTILNPAPMIDFDSEILQYVDIFIPNQHEAGQLLGINICSVADGKNAVSQLLELGIEQVIITLGSDGCVYNVGKEIKHQGIFPINVVDTTAAGDSFIGGICKGLCSNFDIEKTILYATAVSALTVSKKGATTSLPYENEVNKFIG